MPKIEADASPEKRLFAYLITRDISLADAILDLIDNSINAALQPLAGRLKTADEYQALSMDAERVADVEIRVTIGSAKISIEDDAHGISLASAQSDIFRFGRGSEGDHNDDRLSVYGIGLKRAMFKCGNKVHILSDHREGGFQLNLNTKRWEQQVQNRWSFDIEARRPRTEGLGTRIAITELYDDVIRRVEDGLFLSQLKERISRTYAFFLGRIVRILLNGVQIEPEHFEIGDNYANERFERGAVSCNVTAGIAKSNGENFRDRNSGWFVFCNGRAVLSADKTPLTGWASGLPIFQPKHRPFLGTVFFVSADPEALPWTTTKASINEESVVWQEAKRNMIKVGRVITGFLDSRYGDEGSIVTPSELQSASGAGMSVLRAAVSSARSFSAPKVVRPQELKIQYSAKISDIDAIGRYLRKPNISGTEVGKYTFEWFLNNEVGGSK